MARGLELLVLLVLSCMSELQRPRSLACAIIIAVVLFSSSALLRVVTDKYGPRYFMNQVYAAGLSGSECFVWTAVEVQNIAQTQPSIT